MAAYQREWSWVDKQNFVDSVDADDFNAAYQGIGRELDRIADTLAQGPKVAQPAGGLPKPDKEFELTVNAQKGGSQPLTHNLNSFNLMVHMEILDAPFVLDPASPFGWFGGDLAELRRWFWDQEAFAMPLPTYVLPENDANVIHVMWGEVPAVSIGDARQYEVRLRIWKWSAS